MNGRARMYAGGRITRSSPLRIGEPIIRTSTVTRVTKKRGRTGELVLVMVEHQVTPVPTGTDDGIVEAQDLVYRQPSRPSGTAQFPHRASGKPEIHGDWSWGRDIKVEPSLLFRFSALTYNAHRIHYDRDYATTQEGYPGLVIHGPLQAIFLADAIDRTHPDAFVAEFSFRAVAPAFEDQPLRVRLAADPTDLEGTTLRLHAFSGTRHTMSATARLRAQQHSG